MMWKCTLILLLVTTSHFEYGITTWKTAELSNIYVCFLFVSRIQCWKFYSNEKAVKYVLLLVIIRCPKFYFFVASPFGRVKRKIRWTSAEKNTANKIFEEYIRGGNYPSLKKIQEFQKSYPILRNRSPVVIKSWISNQMRKIKLV